MRERALRMLAETWSSHPAMMSAVQHVAGLLGMGPGALRLWQRRYEVDAGVKPGLMTDAAVEIKRLQKENAGLRKANEIRRAASGCSRNSGVYGHRSSPHAAADEPRRRGGREVVRAGVHHGARSGSGETQGSRAAPVHRSRPAPTLNR